MKNQLYKQAITLLKKLIETQSFSGEEDKTADHIIAHLNEANITYNRVGNNIWATNLHFDSRKPSILLYSHHDTVKPNQAYTNNPYEAFEKDGKLYGLGSNDAGGCLVSLIALFKHFYEQKDLKYNLILAASAEEENSGNNGLRKLLPELPEIDFAIVGEPTEMNLAISEKGLLVIDAVAKGISGHAAHNNTTNAIYEAMTDIAWIQQYEFPKTSATLGKVKTTVTQINAGSQHNVVPAECHFVIDCRVNERYHLKEVFEILDKNTKCELKARSFRNNSSSIPTDHPIVKAGVELGRTTYGSPTLSDQANLSVPSLKMGPGLSTRSHQADEYIYLKEIEEGIDIYIQLLEKIM